MKIKYINEAFKKISDLKKDDGKSLSIETIQNESVKDLILPVIENESFIKNVVNYININLYGSTNNDNSNNLSINYRGIKNGILHLSIEFFNIDRIAINTSNDNSVDEIKNKINKNISFLLTYYWNICEPDIKLENIICDTCIDKIVYHTYSEYSDLVVILPSPAMPKVIDKRIKYFFDLINAGFVMCDTKNIRFSYSAVNIAKVNHTSDLYKKLKGTLEYNLKNENNIPDEILDINYNCLTSEIGDLYKIRKMQELAEIRLELNKNCNINWNKGSNIDIIKSTEKIYQHEDKFNMQLSDDFIYAISSKDIEELDRNEMYNIFDTCCMLWEYKDVKSYIDNYILMLSKYLKNIEWFALVIKDGDDYICSMYTFEYGKYIDNYKLNVPKF